MTIGSANVTVEFLDKDGRPEERQLKPSIHAMRRISQRHGGLRQVIDKIEKLDLDAVVDVLEAGLGSPVTVKDRNDLYEAVYRTGVSSDTGRLAELCVTYVIILMRGGRPLPTSEGEEGEENPQGLPSSP